MVENIILRRLKNQEELVLDKVETPNYILDSVDWGSIKGTHHSYKYVNQVGESIAITSLGTRPITITGWIVAESEKHMTLLKRKLNSFINPQEFIELFYSNYTITFKPDETVKYSTEKAENNDCFCKFQISGTAPNPLFSDSAETRLEFVVTKPEFHFPLVISKDSADKGVIFGKRSEDLFTNIFNKGSISVGMKIVFKAKGSVLNPKLINVNTQESFAINKYLEEGEVVEINTNIGEKRIIGKIGNEDYSNYYMYKEFDSSWLQLEVGDNLFKYDAESGANALDVTIYFHNKYLEVQECY